MTAGSFLLRSIGWPGKNKKRQRSGSGGSEALEEEQELKQAGRRKFSGLSLHSTHSIFSSKEPIRCPNQNQQFKFSWPVDGWTQKVENSAGQGFDSKHFKIKLNGVITVWNLSIRFWTNEEGKQISNPFLFCLNLLESKSSTSAPVEVGYKFSVYNRAVEQYDEGPEGVTDVVLEKSDQIQSVGVENVSLEDNNYNHEGDILLQVRLSFNWGTSRNESYQREPSYLKNHPKQPDLVVVAESRLFPVHKKVLAAASTVLAGLIEGLEGEMDIIEDSEVIGRSRDIQNKKWLRNTKNSDNKPKDKIVIPDTPDATVATILEYIYTGHVDDSSCVSWHHLVSACAQYQLTSLQSLCEEHLATLLSPLTVASLLIQAENLSCNSLKRRALQYVRDHQQYIVKDPDWSRMELDNPSLFAEACRQVAPVGCHSHVDCLKMTRYRAEKGRRWEEEHGR